ncbi:MAG TPA: ATP-dependent acyl-CoA ligase [Alcaligenes sp.]|nr:ATP-dependent acyl-CoA ligase [Alcaligenes sp.]HRL26277.1 ATP-dependent acyl-CoA ligase [Alcaligenes sp.]
MHAHSIPASQLPLYDLPATERTLPALLRLRARRMGDAPLFSDRHSSYTGHQTLQAAAASASRLATAGIVRGDRVALLCTNRREFLDIVLGCGWLGAVVVPINTASRGAQLQHILSNSGATLLIVETDLTPLLEHVDLAATQLKQAWLVPGELAAQALDIPTCELPPLGEYCEPADIGPGDTLAILYTSGTSGPSKGVQCPHAQFYWWGIYTASKLGMRPDDVLYTCLPMFHTNALNTFFQALVSDACMIADRKFSASRFFANLHETGATITYLLGAMVPILLSKPVTAAEKLHKTRIALGPGVPEQFHAQFLERCGMRLLDGFGSTETNYVMGRGIEEQRNGYMGRLSDGFEARVVDEHDNELPDGQVGELLLRANEPYAFALGYYGMPEKTVETWKNLWFHTGDRVVRDAQGYYRFVDRLKDMIRRRGENISSFEVEEALSSHPAVQTVAVYAAQSELAEDEVMAMIVLRPDAQVSCEELLGHCERTLPYFAVPRFVEFADSLPTTENGKIQKFALRDRGVGPATWDREKAGYQVRR